MKLTKETLKQIIKEELDAVINEKKESYETKNFDRLSAYGNPGKRAQEMIRKLVADGNYRRLGELADYASSMSLTAGSNNDFGFAMNQAPSPEKLKRTQSHFYAAFRDAHLSGRKSATSGEAPTEKPGVMDRIKGFFKEE